MATIQSTNIYWASDKQSGIEGTIINDIQPSVSGFLWEERLNKKKDYIKMRWVQFSPKIKCIPLLL